MISDRQRCAKELNILLNAVLYQSCSSSVLEVMLKWFLSFFRILGRSYTSGPDGEMGALSK